MTDVVAPSARATSRRLGALINRAWGLKIDYVKIHADLD